MGGRKSGPTDVCVVAEGNNSGIVPGAYTFMTGSNETASRAELRWHRAAQLPSFSQGSFSFLLCWFIPAQSGIAELFPAEEIVIGTYAFMASIAVAAG